MCSGPQSARTKIIRAIPCVPPSSSCGAANWCLTTPYWRWSANGCAAWAAPADFCLTGFPRTTAHAEALEDLLNRAKVTLDLVLNYHLPLEKIVARISGRRTCAHCKAVFHVATRPPKSAGVCDLCSGELMQLATTVQKPSRPA